MNNMGKTWGRKVEAEINNMGKTWKDVWKHMGKGRGRKNEYEKQVNGMAGDGK